MHAVPPHHSPNARARGRARPPMGRVAHHRRAADPTERASQGRRSANPHGASSGTRREEDARMQRSFAGLLALALVCAIGSPAVADPPALVLIRNHADHAVRVQIALGNTMPCDSSDNVMVLDEPVPGGGGRSQQVPADCVCARHTVGEWTTEFGPSLRYCGALRCTGSGRRRSCVRDPGQPILVDVID